jgi:hypothetical protein
MYELPSRIQLPEAMPLLIAVDCCRRRVKPGPRLDARPALRAQKRVAVVPDRRGRDEHAGADSQLSWRIEWGHGCPLPLWRVPRAAVPDSNRHFGRLAPREGAIDTQRLRWSLLGTIPGRAIHAHALLHERYIYVLQFWRAALGKLCANDRSGLAVGVRFLQYPCLHVGALLEQGEHKFSKRGTSLLTEEKLDATAGSRH